ncbi:uncharacterized protein LAJ45_11029 [Morchella importuna]|uniref:uncharacterized protein n=1 Tax=Morchella importuna TaxID=1174673 RepID=UPI001E8D161B|nr:uncharacterized protein LAJ45_11029 [Morchella importuna]KAH8145009.1 hypothetical protein LAJ45_11029 [Morchella importuna]
MGSGQHPIVMINSALARSAQVCKLTPVLLDEIWARAALDLEYLSLKKAIENTSGNLVNRDLTLKDGDVFYKERRYIPNHRELKLKILSAPHDSRTAGHFGQFKTAERLRALSFGQRWTTMWKNTFGVAIHVNALKPQTHKKYGMLQPLEVLSMPWSSISMDFITKATIEELVQIFLRKILRLHVLPEEIISDQDSRIETYRPQTDGQTERVNQTLEQYLKNYCFYQQDDWAELLPLVEYAYNTATQESTKVSPFYANYGFQPDSTWPSLKRKLDNFDASSAAQARQKNGMIRNI